MFLSGYRESKMREKDGCQLETLASWLLCWGKVLKPQPSQTPRCPGLFRGPNRRSTSTLSSVLCSPLHSGLRALPDQALVRVSRLSAVKRWEVTVGDIQSLEAGDTWVEDNVKYTANGSNQTSTGVNVGLSPRNSCMAQNLNKLFT